MIDKNGISIEQILLKKTQTFQVGLVFILKQYTIIIIDFIKIQLLNRKGVL